MNVQHSREDPATRPTPLLTLAHFQDEEASGEGNTSMTHLVERLDSRLGGGLSGALASGDMTGREEESLLLYGPDDGEGPERVLILGAGKRESWDAEGVRRLAGRSVRFAEKLRLSRLSLHLRGEEDLEPSLLSQAGAEGAVLAAWRFREMKSEGDGEEERPPVPVEEMTISGEGAEEPLRAGIRTGVALARGENLTRTLQARPANVATPSHLADEARTMAEEVGLEISVLGPSELREEGMRALLSVSRGSEEEPRFIILTHRGGNEGDRPLVLVGKGLTFDAGGISLKPSKGMERMKFDMSGGAAVIGAMKAVAELGIPRNVVGLVPSSENLPSGSALKPGDVIRTRSGKTVEVINTDAEGRLILSDALDYAKGLDPDAVVDCATLTGACVVALGHHAVGLMGNDDALVEELREAGERSGERCWPLPLWEVYRKQLDSEDADLKNVGGRPGGAVTAGCFLKEFVGEARWAHLDIAGTAYGEDPTPYRRKGAYGVPTRLLVEWTRSRRG